MSGTGRIVSALWRNVIVVCCLVACCFMFLLVQEQNRTIISQRILIRNLFHDSLELNAIKVKAINDARR